MVQEIPLVNVSDAALTAVATFTPCGRGFSGPREVSVPPRSSGAYPLTFIPPGTGVHASALELALAPSGERNTFTLTGRGSDPLAEGHIVLECQVCSG